MSFRVSRTGDNHIMFEGFGMDRGMVRFETITTLQTTLWETGVDAIALADRCLAMDDADFNNYCEGLDYYD